MESVSWTAIILDIVKTSVPALIVFVTAYYLMRSFFKNQTDLSVIKQRGEIGETTKQLKLQAFERLMLYCDRMDIFNTVGRLNQSSMNAEELMTAMLISTQKEYEHNVAQQIYISETLWKVITQAKSSTIQLISSAYDTVNPQDSSQVFIEALQTKIREAKINPSDHAKRALRAEAENVLKH